MTSSKATVSGVAAILFHNIAASAKRNGSPVESVNPRTAELIAAGVLVEIAPRKAETVNGMCRITFTVAVKDR